MNKTLLNLLLLLLPFVANAQRQTEYNRKGDEAMQRKDYDIAKFWYEEGVAYCDRYSIERLTMLWREVDGMHLSMKPVMAKCLNCLTEAATERKDTFAMKQLALYYSEGIGGPKNDASAAYWREQLDEFRNPRQFAVPDAARPVADRMRFFAGYHASAIAPFGLQLGAHNNTWGFYIRLLSNLSFKNRNTQYECRNGADNTGQIPELDARGVPYEFLTANDKPVGPDEKIGGSTRTLIATAGLMYRAFSNVYLSVGAGYARYDLFYRYGQKEMVHSNTYVQTGWARNADESINALALDLDLRFVVARRWYGNIGCTLLKFEKLTPTVGVGFCF